MEWFSIFNIGCLEVWMARTLQLGSREAIQCKKDNHEWCPRIIHFLTGWFPRVAIREERWERMELLIAWRNSSTNLTQRTRNQSWESFVYILRRNSAIWKGPGQDVSNSVVCKHNQRGTNKQIDYSLSFEKLIWWFIQKIKIIWIPKEHQFQPF